MPPLDKKRRRKALQGNWKYKDMLPAFQERFYLKCLAVKNESRDGVVPSVFSWIWTSPRKGKELAERNFELTASKRASRKLSTPGVVLENEMVPDLSDCGLKVEDETQTDFTDQEAYLREIIDNNNKKIHKLEQEIEELKRQLQDTQRQRDALNKRFFNFENCCLLYWLSKLGHLYGCFWVSLSFPTGGQKLTTTLSLITVRADY